MTLRIVTQSLTMESGGIDLRKTVEFTRVLITNGWEDCRVQWCLGVQTLVEDRSTDRKPYPILLDFSENDKLP